MIGWGDVYKVVVAMVPLYVALILGYGSVKWWRLFTREQCDAINRLVCYFTLPLFTFEFTAHVDPFKMNYPFIGADAISKVIIVAVLAFWAKCSSKGSYCWSITSFSLSTLTNALVVGVPLLKAMYGQIGVDLVVQSSVVQAIVWLTFLLFVLEWRRSGTDYSVSASSVSTTTLVLEKTTSMRTFTTTTTSEDASVVNNNINSNLLLVDETTSSTAAAAAAAIPASTVGKDLELGGSGNNNNNNNTMIDVAVVPVTSTTGPSFWYLMRTVWLKLAMNPNSYACIVGLTWAFLSNRWHFEMPSIMEGSILIMSKAGTGTAMFSMGLFMALQENIIACGTSLTVFGMVLRFIAGPAAMAIGAIAVGLHGDVLRVAIIQAALPQSITSFIFAKEYGLHANVLSTAVIFGMIVSFPVLIAYYAILEFLH